MFSSTTDNTSFGGHLRREDDIALSEACIDRSSVSECGRVVVNTLKDAVLELRKDRDARTSQYVPSNSPRMAGTNVVFSQAYLHISGNDFSAPRRRGYPYHSVSALISFNGTYLNCSVLDWRS